MHAALHKLVCWLSEQRSLEDATTSQFFLVPLPAVFTLELLCQSFLKSNQLLGAQKKYLNVK